MITICFRVFLCNGSFFKITKENKKIKEGILNVDYFPSPLLKPSINFFSSPFRERDNGKGFKINVAVKSEAIQNNFLTHHTYYVRVVRYCFENFQKSPSKYP